MSAHGTNTALLSPQHTHADQTAPHADSLSCHTPYPPTPSRTQCDLGLHNGHQPVLLRNLGVAGQAVCVLQDGRRGGALAGTYMTHRGEGRAGRTW